MRMPTLAPSLSQLERETEVVLASDGSITAVVKERSIGQTAVNERRAFKQLSNSQYKGMIENWVTQGASGAKVSKLLPTDDSDERRVWFRCRLLGSRVREVDARPVAGLQTGDHFTPGIGVSNRADQDNIP